MSSFQTTRKERRRSIDNWRTQVSKERTKAQWRCTSDSSSPTTATDPFESSNLCWSIVSFNLFLGCRTYAEQNPQPQLTRHLQKTKMDKNEENTGITGPSLGCLTTSWVVRIQSSSSPSTSAHASVKIRGYYTNKRWNVSSDICWHSSKQNNMEWHSSSTVPRASIPSSTRHLRKTWTPHGVMNSHP